MDVINRNTTAALLLLALTQISALNILGIFPHHGKSHFIVFRTYLQELTRRGHSVTVISHFPEHQPPANYYDISLAESNLKIELKLPIKRSYTDLLATALIMAAVVSNHCEVLLANEEVQNIIKQKSKFHVVIAEQFITDCALGIAYKLKAPVIGITSNVFLPWHYKRFGIPYNPSYVAFHFLEGGSKPTIYQRVERTFFHCYFKMIYYLFLQKHDQNILAHYFDDIPPLEDLAREIKAVLLYQSFVLTGSRLFPANIIEIAGFHVAQPKPLSGELKRFVEDAEHGVIYICFGTNINNDSLSLDNTKALLDAMSEFPQRFIWKWNDKTLKHDNKKLYIFDWLPQVDLLGHPKTLAFLSHAGMGGSTEALHFGVPIIAIPLFGDQPANAAAIEEAGVGVQISVNELTKESLVAAFKKVLNINFRNNVKQISNAWRDRPMSPMDTAIHWTEFVARYPNIKYRTAAADVPLYQYLNLDIILLFSFMLLCLLIITRNIIKLYCGAKKAMSLQKTNKKSKEQ